MILEVQKNVVDSSYTYPSEDPKDWGAFSRPIYKIPVANALEKVLKIFLPKSQQINLGVGLSLGFPLGIKLEQATEMNIELGGFEAKTSTGRKGLKFRYDGSGLPSIDRESEDSSYEHKVTLFNDTGLDSISYETQLKGFAGIMPQVVFESFGLATGSFGLHTGLFFEAAYNVIGDYPPIVDNPGLPVLLGVCDTCHRVRLSLEGGLGDLFLWYKILNSDKVEVDLSLDASVKAPIANACLIAGNCEASGLPTPKPTPAVSHPQTSPPTNLPTPTIEIDVDDLIVFGGGGEPNKDYIFTFRAHGIPDTVENVRFDWSPQLGAPDSAVAGVSNGEATISTQLSYPRPGLFKLDIKVYDGGENLLLTSSWVNVNMAGAVLSINPPSLNEAEIGVQYDFDISASGVQSSEILFGWSFGVGSEGTGSEGVQVIDGMANININHTYATEGAFGLVVDIRNIGDDEVVAESSLVVLVGEKVEREYDLDTCDTWKAVQTGGQGATIDLWDISTIPPGAIFDIYFDCYSIPDRILVQYLNSVVEDTGWRGEDIYDGLEQFPGGVISPGYDSVNGIFNRLSQDYFTVTVIGPHPGTLWGYQIRCRFDELTSSGQSLSQTTEYEADVEEASWYDADANDKVVDETASSAGQMFIEVSTSIGIGQKIVRKRLREKQYFSD